MQDGNEMEESGGSSANAKEDGKPGGIQTDVDANIGTQFYIFKCRKREVPLKGVSDTFLLMEMMSMDV